MRTTRIAAGGEQRGERLGERIGFEGQGAEVVAETGCNFDPSARGQKVSVVFLKETRLTFADGVECQPRKPV